MKRAVVIALGLFLISACGRGGEFSQDEVDAIVDEAVSEALANQTTTTPPPIATTEAAPNIREIVESELESAYPVGYDLDATVTGDETYVSVSDLYDPLLVQNLVEAMRELGFPSSVAARIGNTRALDGTLTADGAGVTASWTYHPDDGLSIVIERKGS